MRKDVKTGLLIGTGLCLAAAVWFSVRQPVVNQPRIEELLSQQKELLAIQEEPKVQINLTDTPAAQTNIESAPSVRMHIVATGETLSDIAKKYYGTVGSWNKIYQANKDQMPKGPNALKTGMKLVIPQ
jgi:nucleoid-associated protein YgaU